MKYSFDSVVSASLLNGISRPVSLRSQSLQGYLTKFSGAPVDAVEVRSLLYSRSTGLASAMPSQLPTVPATGPDLLQC